MLKRSQNSNIHSFAFLAVFSFSEKVIAFVYQAVLAAVLGASVATDCYYAASQLFDLIDSTVLGALIVVIINRFATITAEKDEKAGFDFLSRFNTLLTVVISVLAVLTFIFARPISFVIAPGFDEVARPRLVECIRILCVIPPMMVFATLAQGLLRQKKCFIIVNSRSLCISLCGMAAVLGFSMLDPTKSRVLCIGYVVANLLFSVLLFIRSRKFGVIGFKKPAFDDDFKKLFVMAVPAIISTGIVRISLMIDQVVSSSLGEGSVSYLNYAHSLYNIVSTLLIVNLCVIMLTDFTNLRVKNEFAKMKEKLQRSISLILLILAPVTILTCFYSDQIVSIVYERGAFTSDSSKVVGSLLLFYAIGFIPAMLNSIHTQVLHAFSKMNVAMRNSLVSFGINIVLNLVLSHFLGIIGIALATTIASASVVYLCKWSVKKCLPGYKRIIPLRFGLKLLAGSAGCALVAFLFKKFIHRAVVSFALATVVGFLIFAGILLLLREENLMGLLGKIFHRKKGGSPE